MWVETTKIDFGDATFFSRVDFDVVGSTSKGRSIGRRKRGQVAMIVEGRRRGSNSHGNVCV
jgi:hypothetical protein